MIIALLSIFWAVLLGFVWIRCLAPPEKPNPVWAALVLEIALGIGLGIGVTSCLFFLLLLRHAAKPPVMIACEAVLLAGGLVYMWRRDSSQVAPVRAENFRFEWNWVLAVALLGGLLLFLAAFSTMSQTNPQGEWDAWSIWNLRAKFLVADSDLWKRAMSPLLDRTHPDYPLLVSAFVGRGWLLGGEMTPAVPVITALLLPLAAIGVLVSALVIIRSTSAGLSAGLVLLASSSYLGQTGAQYADLPLSFYMLAAFALITMEDSYFLLAGLFASLAAWAKNEGLVFLVIFLGCVLVNRNFSSLRLLLIGAAPITILALVFKLFLAPAADPLLKQSATQAIHKLAEPGRYIQIAEGFFGGLVNSGSAPGHPLILLAIQALIVRFSSEAQARRCARMLAGVLALMMAAYFAVFLITPYDLGWHLGTSVERLYAQVWPAFLFTVFMALRRFEDLACAGA